MMTDKEAEVAQLRKLDFKTGGNGPVELYDKLDAVLKILNVHDQAMIVDGEFTVALVVLELAIVKSFANRASSLDHFASGMQLVIGHFETKTKQIITATLAGAL